MTDHSDPVRTELLRCLGRTLASLFPGEPLDAVLTGWCSGLPTTALVRCVQPSPDDTADALARALSIVNSTFDPRAEIVALAATEYPRLSPGEIAQLAEFTLTLRELAILHGDVSDTHLAAEGYSPALQRRLTGMATRLIAVLACEVAPSTITAPASPTDRLRKAGEAAALRHSLLSSAA